MVRMKRGWPPWWITTVSWSAPMSMIASAEFESGTAPRQAARMRAKAAESALTGTRRALRSTFASASMASVLAATTRIREVSVFCPLGSTMWDSASWW